MKLDAKTLLPVMVSTLLVVELVAAQPRRTEETRSANMGESARRQRLQQRLAYLEDRWTPLTLEVARLTVKNQCFVRSTLIWQAVGGRLDEDAWSDVIEGDLDRRLQVRDQHRIVVAGDCTASLFAGTKSIIHVRGDLTGTMVVDSLSEIVIGGDIGPTAVLECNGVVQLFVGGAIHGFVASSGSLEVWAKGDLDGEIRTGVPSTHLTIGSDLTGTVRPLNEPGLLYIDVTGSCTTNKITEIARHGYTSVAASIGESDRAPGIYGSGPAVCWIAHSNAQVRDRRALDHQEAQSSRFTPGQLTELQLRQMPAGETQTAIRLVTQALGRARADSDDAKLRVLRSERRMLVDHLERLASADRQDAVVLAFNDVRVAEIVRFLEYETHKRVVASSEALQRKITLVSDKPVSRVEVALRVVDALRDQGFIVVETDGSIEITLDKKQKK